MSGPLSLAITASRGPCSIAVRDAGGALHLAADSDAARMPDAVRALFAALRREPADLGELRVDLGPGSYTGLRVALTFARTLQSFAGVRTLATTSLQLIALIGWTEQGIDRQRIVRPVLDARRGRLHHAPVRFEPGVALAAPPRATTPQELRAAIEPQETLVAPAELHALLAPLAAERGAELREAGTHDGRHLFHAALALQETEPADLEPLYLMGSYAE